MYQLDKNTPLGKNLWFFVKWSAVSTLIGLTTGLVGTVFGHLVMRAGAYFNSHRWTLALLPAAGLMIVWIYHFLKEDKNRGTNMVIESIYTDSDISPGTAPAIFLGTILTHFSGGSAGREGAALQMGGSIGNQIGRLMKLDEKD